MIAVSRTLLALLSLVLAQATPAPVTYEAYAVRFGILPAFQVSGLVAGADRSRTLDIPVMVWLVNGSNGRVRARRDLSGSLPGRRKFG